ncbi:hypothetical protein INR49_002190 [Caranx melampygus]|nr:hypothetical protein INR49_002190 [Caranx melampygus]
MRGEKQKDEHVVGLLLPNQTLVSTIFWQWLNQSHNACVNYSNRNASKPAPLSKFVQGYVGAVTSAVSIAVGLKVLIQRANRFSPTTRLLVQRFIPFPAVELLCDQSWSRAHLSRLSSRRFDSRSLRRSPDTFLHPLHPPPPSVAPNKLPDLGTRARGAFSPLSTASANVCNVVLMRHLELSQGISVLDNNGNVVGTSRVAARHALLETALTRVVLPMPILLLPPMIMAALEK